MENKELIINRLLTIIGSQNEIISKTITKLTDLTSCQQSTLDKLSNQIVLQNLEYFNRDTRANYGK